MRQKKKYSNGQQRGGVPGVAVDSSRPKGREKDYHRQAVAFQGGDAAVERWKKGGMKGYKPLDR